MSEEQKEGSHLLEKEDDACKQQQVSGAFGDSQKLTQEQQE
jgi:hypothetical protein